MKIVLVLVTVALVGCGRQETDCGMSLRPTQPTTNHLPWTLENLQEAETYALDAFAKTVVNDERFDPTTACKSLQGTVVVVRPEPFWINVDGIMVAGETPCLFKTIYTNGVDGDRWNSGSLVHEMAHMIQNCEPRKPWVIEDMGNPDFYHQHWNEDGIGTAIGLANGIKERDRNENP